MLFGWGPTYVSIDVIVINDFAETNGGAAQVALASAFGLAASGHRVTIFSAVPPAVAIPTHPNLTLVVTGQHEIAQDPNRLRAVVQGIWNWRAGRMLRLTLQDFDSKNTIVHLHGWSKALSSSVVRECVDKSFSVVCTLHDYFVACPNGGFYNFRTNEICHLDPLSARCVLENCDSRSYAQKSWRVARQIVQRQFGGIPGGISAFIAVSNFSKVVLQSYLPKGCRLFEIRNPVISQKDPPALLDEASPFLYVGRLSPEKGGVLLASAAADLDCDLVYVGEGVSRPDIEMRNQKARFTGWLPRSETLNWVRRARALVLPSLWYETQGLVVLEAAALGVPAIVPDTSAARDLVIDGQSGLWFRGGDQKSLRAAMQRLMVTQVARDMGRSAYEQYWRDPPTISDHILRLEKAYVDILEGATA
jgi:glycosyltransferase involved in cell wall biosynthesis